VTITVTLASPEVLTVPANAIQTAQSGQHVYVVKDGIADIRPVVVERTYENVAVIAKGLTEGETVVTDGQLRVIPKKPVEVKEAGATTGKGGKGGKGKGDKGGDGKTKTKEKKEAADE
jgi:membrane fusion protein, multidrug efflux system